MGQSFTQRARARAKQETRGLLNAIAVRLDNYADNVGFECDGVAVEPFDYLAKLLAEQRPEIMVPASRLRNIFMAKHTSADLNLTDRLLLGLTPALEKMNQQFPDLALNIEPLREQIAIATSGVAASPAR